MLTGEAWSGEATRTAFEARKAVMLAYHRGNQLGLTRGPRPDSHGAMSTSRSANSTTSNSAMENSATFSVFTNFAVLCPVTRDAWWRANSQQVNHGERMQNRCN